MGRYGPHYRRQPTQRRGLEVSTTMWRTEISGRQNGSGPESSDTDDATEDGLQFCSVGRIGPSPSHLFESARLHSHPLLITPEDLGIR